MAAMVFLNFEIDDYDALEARVRQGPSRSEGQRRDWSQDLPRR